MPADHLPHLRALVEAYQRGEIPGTIYVEGMTIRIAPTRPTSCEVDLLALIATHQPIPTSRILEALEARGQLHGETTVRRTLARMVKSGQLRSSRFAPRGYTLPTFNGCHLPRDV